LNINYQSLIRPLFRSANQKNLAVTAQVESLSFTLFRLHGIMKTTFKLKALIFADPIVQGKKLK